MPTASHFFGIVPAPDSPADFCYPVAPNVSKQMVYIMSQEPDLAMSAATLYREENFTDRKIGNIRRLTPVDANGEADSSRETIYIGQTQMMTNMGPLPLSFEIAAKSLEEACNGFADAAKQAVDRTIEEAKEMQRQAASQIVIPDATGGMPGGGKIQLP